jgi:hypothetical protein
MDSINDFGFIILRCIRNKEHNNLFKECYQCIRQFYDNKIIIIDDNSDKSLVDQYDMVNTDIIESEYPGCGEILPCYYFYKLKPFQKAVIIHDSMFIKKKIDFTQFDDIRFLWHFDNHIWDEINIEIKYINQLNYIEGLGEKYIYGKWNGCFGGACVISYDFVKLLNDKYNLFKLLDIIKTRHDRMGFERIFGLISFFENKLQLNYSCSINSLIHNHPYAFILTYDMYKNINLPNLNMIKVWNGR